MFLKLSNGEIIVWIDPSIRCPESESYRSEQHGEISLLTAQWHMKRIRINDKFTRAKVILELKEQLKSIFCESTLTVHLKPEANSRVGINYCDVGLCSCFKRYESKKDTGIQENNPTGPQVETNEEPRWIVMDRMAFIKQRKEAQKKQRKEAQKKQRKEDSSLCICFSELFKISKKET